MKKNDELEDHKSEIVVIESCLVIFNLLDPDCLCHSGSDHVFDLKIIAQDAGQLVQVDRQRILLAAYSKEYATRLTRFFLF